MLPSDTMNDPYQDITEEATEETTETPIAYTVEQVAMKAQVSRKTVWNWVNNGTIRVVRIGRVVRIPESELDRLFS